MPPFRFPIGFAAWGMTGIVLITAALFWQVRGFDFVNLDDHEYVVENPHVCDGLTINGIAWAFSESHSANWHPLTWLSLQLDSTLFGTSPGGYHVTNLVLHLANLLLLFGALRAMTGAAAQSACVAALFAIHPLHVESVAWISERKDVLSTFFWMLTLLSYAHYAARPTWSRYALVVVPFALGLTAKAMLVTLPCVLLLLDFWPLRRWPSQGERRMAKRERHEGEKGKRRRREEETSLNTDHSSLTRLIIEKLPLLTLSAVSSVLTLAAQSKGETIATVTGLPLALRLMNAADAYFAYLGKAIWPLDLAVYYPYKGHHAAFSLIAAALLAATSIWAWRRRDRQPYLAVGWFWYLGTLLPVIGVVQVGSQAMADRYTYVPLIGVFIAMVWGLADLVAKGIVSRASVAALAAVALTGFGLCTWVQVGYWRDSVTLWAHTIAVTGNSDFACCCLGIALRERGQIEAALPYLDEAAKLAPGMAVARENLGTVLFVLGKNDRSREEYEALVQLKPNHAGARRTLAALSRREGDLEQAAGHLRDALAIDPNDWRAHWGLGEVLVEQGLSEKGQWHLDQAARLNPQFSAHARAPAPDASEAAPR